MFPAIIFPVDAGIDVDCKDLAISECLDCRHAFQTDIDANFNQALYTKYYKYYPYGSAEFFLDHYRQPFERLFSAMVASKKSGRLLEIGASDEAQLKTFSDHGFDVMAISPDAGEGSRVISAFYEDHTFNDKFDVLVSRFNLEHIVDLDVFMSKASEDLNEGGFLIVQVPNVSAYRDSNIINFYVHEHTHYFTRESLEGLFKRHGFSIEALHSYNSPSLIIIGSKEKPNAATQDQYKTVTGAVVDEVRQLVTESVNANEKVAFYGAGLSLTGLLYSHNETATLKNILVFDDNPIVQGKILPGTDIHIQKPDLSKLPASGTIILALSPIYHDTVISKIRGAGCQNRIYCINEQGLIASER